MEHFWVQNGHMCSTISCLICSRREMLCQDPRKTTPWCLSKLLENPNYSSTLKEPKNNQPYNAIMSSPLKNTVLTPSNITLLHILLLHVSAFIMGHHQA